MQQISVHDAQSELQELLDAAMRGETVLIIGENEQKVQLVPVLVTKHARKAGSAEGLVSFAQDFDEPLPDFDEYVG